jgi:hypothetical protein
MTSTGTPPAPRSAARTASRPTALSAPSKSVSNTRLRPLGAEPPFSHLFTDTKLMPSSAANFSCESIICCLRARTRNGFTVLVYKRLYIARQDGATKICPESCSSPRGFTVTHQRAMKHDKRRCRSRQDRGAYGSGAELTIAAVKQVRVAHLLAAEWRVGQANGSERTRTRRKR